VRTVRTPHAAAAEGAPEKRRGAVLGTQGARDIIRLYHCIEVLIR
jgi:hypothetical protein